MSETEASIGYGTVLEIALASAPTVFTYIKEVYQGTPPADSDDQIDASHWQSPNRTREYIPGLTDTGEASFEMNYVPGSPTDRFLRSIRGKKLVARLTFANGVQVIFRCSRQSYEQDVPNDDKKTATLTLKVSGDPIMTEVTAPRNLILPTIEGVAKVGAPLTADGGAWAGATGIAYQWQADAADIVDAEGQSYVPVAGDVGKVIKVVVTGSNADFDTTAESAATVAVVA